MPSPKEKSYTSEDYWNLPEGERAELIDGQLYSMALPGRMHQKIIMELSAALHDYIRTQNGVCEVYPVPFAVNLDAKDRDWVEPDISVICDTNKLTDRGCSGAPDFIIEVISPSTQGLDYLRKLLLYQKSGVREYWIVNPITRNVNIYTFYNNNSASYSFGDSIPVGIYGGRLSICIAELLN